MKRGTRCREVEGEGGTAAEGSGGKGKEGVKSEQRGEGEGWETSHLQDTSNTFWKTEISRVVTVQLLWRELSIHRLRYWKMCQARKEIERAKRMDKKVPIRSIVLPILAAIHFPDTMQSRVGVSPAPSFGQ